MPQSRAHRLLITGMLFLVVLVCAGCARAGASPTWTPLAAGLQTATMSVRQGTDSARVIVVRADPARCVVRVVAHTAGVRAAQVCPRVGAAINAGFFDEDGRPIGLLVVDGVHRQRRTPAAGYGTFQVRHGRPEIVLSSTAATRGVTQAIECRPRLVIDNALPRFRPQSASRRSAVGIDAQGRVLLLATDDYLTLETWARMLRETCGCVQALNLDGGPSTQLTVRGHKRTTTLAGAKVPVFLTVAPQDATAHTTSTGR